MASLEERAEGEQVRRLAHARLLVDPRVREIQSEIKRAVADADTREGRLEALRVGQDRLGEHLGICRRPR
jgi:hypothetical protein